MTTYTAIIPSLYSSKHTSQQAAIRAIRKAEQRLKVAGTVLRIDDYPTYILSTCVYGFFGVGNAL